jgi:hypothetical protein
MTTFGKIKEFNGEHEEWKHYIERINHFFVANEIEDEGKQRSIFLVSQGSSSEDSPNEESAPPAYSMFTFGHKSTTPYKVNISINGTSIDMEIDTGASLSVISEATYVDLHSEGKVPPLGNTDVILRTYTGEEVKPKGSLEVTASYDGK